MRLTAIAAAGTVCGVLILAGCDSAGVRSPGTAGTVSSASASASGGSAMFTGGDLTPDNSLHWSSEQVYADASSIYGDQLSMCEALGIDEITIKLLQAPFAVQPTSTPAALKCAYSDNVGGSRPVDQTVSATLTATIDPPKSYAAKYVYDVLSLGEPQPSPEPGFTSTPLGLGTDSAVVSTGLNFWSLAKTSSAQYGVELHVSTADVRDRDYYIAAVKAALEEMMRHEPHPIGG